MQRHTPVSVCSLTFNELSHMKTILFMSAALLTGTGAIAQNTAVINQSGGQQVSVVQSGGGNSSVISQNTGSTGNRAVVSQSGSGNVATITQGGNTGTDGKSVSVSQTGNTETHFDQTDGQNNHIIINQTGGVAPDASSAERTPTKRNKRKAKKADQ